MSRLPTGPGRVPTTGDAVATAVVNVVGGTFILARSAIAAVNRAAVNFAVQRFGPTRGYALVYGSQAALWYSAIQSARAEWERTGHRPPLREFIPGGWDVTGTYFGSIGVGLLVNQLINTNHTIATIVQWVESRSSFAAASTVDALASIPSLRTMEVPLLEGSATVPEVPLAALPNVPVMESLPVVQFVPPVRPVVENGIVLGSFTRRTVLSSELPPASPPPSVNYSGLPPVDFSVPLPAGPIAQAVGALGRSVNPASVALFVIDAINGWGDRLLSAEERNQRISRWTSSIAQLVIDANSTPRAREIEAELLFLRPTVFHDVERTPYYETGRERAARVRAVELLEELTRYATNPDRLGEPDSFGGSFLPDEPARLSEGSSGQWEELLVPSIPPPSFDLQPAPGPVTPGFILPGPLPSQLEADRLRDRGHGVPPPRG